MSTDLAELFARDPLQLSEQDISTIVDVFRARRQEFKEDEKAGKKPTARKAAAPKVKDDTAKVMGELDLDKLMGDL
jgi:hypothetical protein